MVIFPTTASVPELIIGDVVTFGTVAKELLVGIPLLQLPDIPHTLLVVPVQIVVCIVKASDEKGRSVSPSPLTTLVQFESSSTSNV